MTFRILHFLIATTLLLSATAIHASSSVVFKNDTVIIEPSPQQSVTGDNSQENNTAPISERKPIEISVNIRPLISLYREGFYANRQLEDREGILLESEIPTSVQIRQSSMYIAVDILGVNEEGTITSIIPNITPSELMYDINLPGYIKALLYVPGGHCKKYNILPGDKVIHHIFHPPPKIIQQE